MSAGRGEKRDLFMGADERMAKLKVIIAARVVRDHFLDMIVETLNEVLGDALSFEVSIICREAKRISASLDKMSGQAEWSLTERKQPNAAQRESFSVRESRSGFPKAFVWAT
jgi:hypothetical protein